MVFDPDAPWVLDPAELKSKCKNTPFDEARLLGRVVRTIVAAGGLLSDSSEAMLWCTRAPGPPAGEAERPKQPHVNGIGSIRSVH